MKTKKLNATEPGFWPAWLAKLMFTLISVKVWGLVAGTALSTWLLMVNLHHAPSLVDGKAFEYGINGQQWITFNTTIWALIFGMKEIFRISENRDHAEHRSFKKQANTKLAMAMMNAAGEKGDRQDGSRPVPSATPATYGEFEIMPDEPDQKV